MFNENSGKIYACREKSKTCGYKCGSFSDNYIVMYPGEYEMTELKKDHLQIIENNYWGGKKVICTTRCFDEDYKPIDCQSYPYFPFVDMDNNIKIQIGTKCPLTKNELLNHKEHFLKNWEFLLSEQIIEWIKHINLIGYKTIEDWPNEYNNCD